MKRAILALLIMIMTASLVVAQDESPSDDQCTGVTNAPEEVVTEIDGLLALTVNEEAGERSAPGAVIRIETPDWIYYEAAGVANIETLEAINCEQPFEIGSNTKMMTATVILQLQEEGLLNIDDLLSDYLPEYAEALPFGDQITLRHLANHTSGIFSYTDDAPDGTPGLMAGDFESMDLLEQGYTPDEMVQFAIEHGEPYFEPGAEGQFEYSNTNFVLLGIIIENLTDQELVDVYEERIFTPLGMDDTFLWNDVPEESFNLPQGYWIYPFEQNVTNMNLSQGWAAGGVISTADDMNLFIRGLLNGELFENEETLAIMQATVPAFGLGQYGIGLISKPAPIEAWGHGGQTLGFQTDVAYLPEYDMSIIYFSNSGNDLAGQGTLFLESALMNAGVFPSEDTD